MNLRALIEESYKEAIKSKNLEKANTIRLIKSALKDKEIENKKNKSNKGIDDNQLLTLLQNLIKQRKESIDSFKIASREDLIAKEKFEIDLINQFLPQQLNELEIKNIINKIIEEKKFSSLKDMGILMNSIKIDHAGSVDMAIAGKIAKTLLSS